MPVGVVPPLAPAVSAKRGVTWKMGANRRRQAHSDSQSPRTRSSPPTWRRPPDTLGSIQPSDRSRGGPRLLQRCQGPPQSFGCMLLLLPAPYIRTQTAKASTEEEDGRGYADGRRRRRGSAASCQGGPCPCGSRNENGAPQGPVQDMCLPGAARGASSAGPAPGLPAGRSPPARRP